MSCVDATNDAPRNAVLQSNDGLGHTGKSQITNDRQNITVGKLCTALHLPLQGRVSSLSHFVINVILECSKEKMGWIDAKWRVAVMANKHSRRNRADELFV